MKAVKLYLREGTTFDVLFEDGLTKRFDILSLSTKYPQLNRLKNRDLFLKGHLLGWGGIVWDEDLDIESETVYEDGSAVPNDDNTLLIILGFKIKEARIECMLTQKELSLKTGISQGDISRIEKGILNPTVLTLDKISKSLKKRFQIELVEI